MEPLAGKLQEAATLNQDRLRQKQKRLLEQGVGPQELLKMYSESETDADESDNLELSKDSDSKTPERTSSSQSVVEEVSSRFNISQKETEEMLALFGY